MTKLTALMTAALALPVIALSAPAAYANTTQSNEFFGVANVTVNQKEPEYVEEATALACKDTMEYAVIVDNTDGTTPMEWQAGVTLPTAVGAGIVSTAEVSASTAPQTGYMLSETVMVNMVPNSRLAYIDNSVELYTGNHTDGFGGAAVDKNVVNGTFVAPDALPAGDMAYLFFQAEVVCENQAPTGDGVTTPNNTNVAIAPITKTTTNKPSMLVKTGAADVAAILTAIAAVSALAYNFVLRRQNAR